MLQQIFQKIQEEDYKSVSLINRKFYRNIKNVIGQKVIRTIGKFYLGTKKDFNIYIAYEKVDSKILFICQQPERKVTGVTKVNFGRKYTKIKGEYTRTQQITVGRKPQSGNLTIIEEEWYKYTYHPEKIYKTHIEIKGNDLFKINSLM